jgi:hypothetical protein
MKKAHSFHIPVMGIGFTLDTPFRVSRFGIDSVVSLVDDILIEKIRKVYCEKFEIPYHEISEKIEDFRAKRITSYLNLMNEITEKKFNELKNTAEEKKAEIKAYFHMLPDSSSIKKEFLELTSKYFNLNDISDWLKENMSIGKIDVNIMTKIDKDNYRKGEKLPIEYNDAHAALRGYAESDLDSTLVLSAGMNPRLYSYIENYDDFFPNEKGEIKKRIALKVSDYRSALIQGKFFAKKGIWVSEYRIESGLNCGGHAFATDGYLMGPILEEFKEKRQELTKSIYEVLLKSLECKNRIIPKNPLTLKITAQGGVGTHEEHEFLLNHYDLDSVGWGSPFLLVPEAVSIDRPTMQQLIEAKEKDLYLSNISPLGVPFNSLRGNTKDVEKLELAKQGIPGSKCPKRYLVSNKDYSEKAICTASRQYQRIKIQELEQTNLSPHQLQIEKDKIIDKSCICVGLGTSALKVHNVDTKVEGDGISVCPGPNTAYFSKEMSLQEMIDHIYGRINVISANHRPNLFVKELRLYVDYLKTKIEETKISVNKKQEKYLITFTKNLKEGIDYYQKLFSSVKEQFVETKNLINNDLEKCRKILEDLHLEIEALTLEPIVIG